MDPKFVNLLIQQLLNTTTCPKCGSPILPINVKIEALGENNCLFKMQCAKCKTVISADAQMTKQKPINVSKVPQKSLQKKTRPQPPKVIQQTKDAAISLDDIMLMKKQLQNFPGSFKNLFQ